MSLSDLNERHARAATEAAQWALKIESDQITASERHDFVDWLRESPVHVAEMLRHGHLESALGNYVDWSQVPAADQADLDAENRFAPEGASPEHRFAGTAVHNLRIAAGLLVVVLVGAFGYLWWHGTAVTTNAGERREVSLDDGSVLRLAPSTVVRVKLRRTIRWLELDRGEAEFRVAKDASRPFVVHAAQTQVKAIGTVFTVARNVDTVVVSVSEGHVAVVAADTLHRSDAAATPRQSIALQSHDRIAISTSGIPGEIRHFEGAGVADWNDRELVFDNVSVSDVVKRFNGRNQLQIRINDPALAERSVSGIFDADDPSSFVDFLMTIADATITRSGSDELVVASKAASVAPAFNAH